MTKNIFFDLNLFLKKQAQNLCIDASVEQRLTKSKFVENYVKFLKVKEV